MEKPGSDAGLFLFGDCWLHSRCYCSAMKNNQPRTFPFLPKSNARLMPGDFWSMPIAPGRYAAGRVIELPWQHAGGSDRRMFLAGLMDWCGKAPPGANDLANRAVLEQGVMHVRAFSFSDWQIEGNRDLASDGIESWLAKVADHYVQKGLGEERLGTPLELSNCPRRSTWGMKVIEIAAQIRFGARP
jgi:hypothetical protein